MNKPIDAVHVLKEFLAKMHREGRVVFVDESTKREFRRVDGQLVEVTVSNTHSFPEAAVWVSMKAAAP